VKIWQVVASEQPYEAVLGIKPFKMSNRVDRERRAGALLEIANPDAGSAGHPLG
jgi:hypothetical protein